MTRKIVRQRIATDRPEGGLPDPRLADLLPRVCSADEKEECLRELLHAAIEAVHGGGTERLRQVLRAWEYTCLWKKDPEALRKLREESAADDDSGEPADWRNFLDSLFAKGR